METRKRVHRTLGIEELGRRIAPAVILNADNPVFSFVDFDGDLIEVTFSGPGEVALTGAEGGTLTDGEDIAYVRLYETTMESALTIRDLDPDDGTLDTMTLGDVETVACEGLGVLEMVTPEGVAGGMEIDVDGDLGVFRVDGQLWHSQVTCDGLGAAVVTGDVRDVRIGVSESAAAILLGGDVLCGDIEVRENLGLFRSVESLQDTDVWVGGDTTRAAVFGEMRNSEIQILGSVDALLVRGHMTLSTVKVWGAAESVYMLHAQDYSTVNLYSGVDELVMNGGMTGATVYVGGDMISFSTTGGVGVSTEVTILGDLESIMFTDGMTGGDVTVDGSVTEFVIDGDMTHTSSVHVTGDVGYFEVSEGIRSNSTVTIDGAVNRAYISTYHDGGMCIDDTSVVTFGTLYEGMTAVGEMAGTIDILGATADSHIVIQGDLTGALKAGLFGDVSITGSFSGTIGDAGTMPGQGTLQIGEAGGGGMVVPANAFAEYYNYP